MYRRVRDIAAKAPQDIAIIDGERSVTFGALLAAVDGRADGLRAAGVAAGTRVAVIAESSDSYIGLALAVWKLDAVLVTIYPSSSDADIVTATRSADPALAFVGDARLLDVLGSQLPALPAFDIAGEGPWEIREDVRPNPTDLREPLSLICFSSGSTSRPKAIMLAASTVCNAARTYAEMWHLTSRERALVSLPMAWLYGLLSTSLAVLYAGGAVVVARRGRPELLTALAREHRATFIAGVTVTYAKLLELAESEDVAAAFEHLRLAITGGEPRNDDVCDRWTALTGVGVLDAYCASECIPLFTYDAEKDPLPRRGSAGQLVPRQRIRVVDANGEDVPSGVVGELIATGPGLMLGYWEAPEATAAALTSDGWFRMRDLVRIDDEGYVYVVGRTTDVIIRGGTNISPAEVESVLHDHPMVRQAAVLGLPDGMYGQKVVAAVVLREGFSDTSELQAYARARVSAYKVPSEFVVVAALPMSPTTSKVDKKALVGQLSALA